MLHKYIVSYSYIKLAMLLGLVISEYNKGCSYTQQNNIRPTIINSLFPVLVREKYHAGGRLLFIILLKIIIISRINATYTLGI